jgi:hypothetical protein
MASSEAGSDEVHAAHVAEVPRASTAVDVPSPCSTSMLQPRAVRLSAPLVLGQVVVADLLCA